MQIELAVNRADLVAAGRFLSRARLLWHAIGDVPRANRVERRLRDLSNEEGAGVAAGS